MQLFKKPFLIIFLLFSFQVSYDQITIKGKLFLHTHAEINGKRADQFQVIVKEDTAIIGNAITDNEGQFKIYIRETDHKSHSEISEPTFDIFFISNQSSQDTILVKSLTHFDGGNIELNLFIQRRGFIPGENNMPICPKCRQSNEVEKLKDTKKPFGFYYCKRDKVRF